MEEATTDERWWKSFYDNTPFHLYLERHDPVELQSTLVFLAEHLDILPGARLFDQCCGMGSVSIPFAKLGFEIVGVDLCENFIARAKSDTASGALPARYFVGDAFQFVPDVLCDGAFNWYTSFGYSAEDKENIRMIERAFESLKPGACFALDFPNVPMIRKHFQSLLERKLESAGGDILIARRCVINDEAGLMEQTWEWTLPDGRVIKNNSTLRLYEPEQLVEMFAQIGFTDMKLFGSLEGDIRNDESGRCICVGRKPL